MKHALLALVASFLAACATAPLEQRSAYPGDGARTRTLDVQVFREGTVLELANSTPSPLASRTGDAPHGGRLWLNAWFSSEIPRVAVGETIRLPLSSFRDRHGDRFRAGGFFATETPDPVVLAELELDGELFRLVVVRDRPE